MKKIVIFCGTIAAVIPTVLWCVKKHLEREKVRKRLANLKEVQYGQN